MADRPATDIVDDAPARLEEIDRLFRTDPARATALAQAALADGLDGAVLHAAIGQGLKSADRFEEAILAFGKALERQPQNAMLMTQVGLCLLELGRREQAAQVLGAAVKLDPNSARTNFAYGWAAENLGALEQAEAAWERAVSLDPGRADALAGLSGLAARRRDWETARDLAEQALALDPTLTDATMNLARVDIGLGQLDAAEQRLGELIGRSGLKPTTRPNAKLLLGDALDAAGRYEAAFAAYADGKSDLRSHYADEFGATERPSAPAVARAMAAEFAGTPEASWSLPVRPVARGPARGHAFLVGFPRSGTTLLEQVIATHPDMIALGERPVMVDAESQFLSRAGGMIRLAGAVSDLLEPLRDAYWRRAREFGVEPAGKVFVDKHPLSTLRLPLISKVFPDAKIIFAVRDPRDVVLSCFRRGFRMNAVNYEFTAFESAARMYDAVMTAGATYFERLPLKTHQVRYEDLIADFEGQVSALCDFLGVAWTDKLRDFAATNRAIATPSSTQVRRGLYEEGAGHWRNYAEPMAAVIPILQPWIERFGYADG
jgi:tetratricopeptide (TPR) repeat protein